jgi:hypothetical protein
VIISKKLNSCTELFKTNGNFTFLFSIYIFLLSYVVNNKHLFTKNLAVHNNDIRSANNFHLHFTNLTKYQKAIHYVGIKIFNPLPTHIYCVANGIQIVKLALKRFLLSNWFCSFEKYLNSNIQYILQFVMFECYN